MLILTYSYFDLKKDIKTEHKEFVKSVDDKVTKIQEDVNNIRIGQESIKGDIKVILDRQTRSTPFYVQPSIPPIIPNVVRNDSVGQ